MKQNNKHKKKIQTNKKATITIIFYKRKKTEQNKHKQQNKTRFLSLRAGNSVYDFLVILFDIKPILWHLLAKLTIKFIFSLPCYVPSLFLCVYFPG